MNAFEQRRKAARPARWCRATKSSSASRPTPSCRPPARSSAAPPPPSAPSPTRRPAPVDLALPGTLPVMNKGAVERAIKLGLALGSHIAPRSVFARKNYFYPDLPKGYQISQYEIPVVQGGAVELLPRRREEDRAPGARAPRRRRRQVAARGLRRPVGHRPEPRRHAAAGDRDRARHALDRRGRGLRARSCTRS